MNKHEKYLNHILARTMGSFSQQHLEKNGGWQEYHITVSGAMFRVVAKEMAVKATEPRKYEVQGMFRLDAEGWVMF